MYTNCRFDFGNCRTFSLVTPIEKYSVNDMLHSHVFCFKKGKENGLRHTSHITQPIICLPVTPSFLLPLFLLLPVAGFVLRQFCDSVLVPYSNLALRFANSAILCWFRALILHALSLRFRRKGLIRESLTPSLPEQISQCASPILQFCAGSVLLDPACASPVLQFCAGCALKTVHRASISRQFCDSLLTFDPAKSFANSAILCQFRSSTLYP